MEASLTPVLCWTSRVRSSSRSAGARVVALVLVRALLVTGGCRWRTALERGDPGWARVPHRLGEVALAGLVGLLELLPIGRGRRLRRTVARIDVRRRPGRAVVLHALAEVIHLLLVRIREIAAQHHHAGSSRRRGGDLHVVLGIAGGVASVVRQ